MDFLERVTYVLGKKSATRPWLAKESGVSLDTINGWYNKGRLPKLNDAIRIAEALQVSVDYLATGRVVETVDDPDLAEMCDMLRSFSRDELMMAKGILLTMQYSHLRPKGGQERERRAANG